MQNGKRWNSVGVNSYDLLEQSQDVIDARLSAIADGGHNTVRTWCFDKDGGLRDDTLSRLAATLNSARQRGLHVICTIGNTLDSFGGPATFTPPGEDFFSSRAARFRYSNQIRKLLDFRDAHGVRLADQQAILAWDLLNEPRPGPATPNGAVADWTRQMGELVGSLDQRHLVTVGAEGFGPGYPADRTLAGREGADFATLCAIPSITLCSAHLFPGYLDAPDSSDDIGSVVQDWRTAADRVNKPVVLEEVGYAAAEAKRFAVRQAFFDNVSRAVANSDIDGGLLWNVGPHVDPGYTLEFGDARSERTLTAWANLTPKTR